MYGVLKIKLLLPITVLLIVGSFNIAHADGGDSTNGEWEFSLAPLFLWAQGIEGSSQIGPVEGPLDITFKDALSNLDAMFTIHYEMKRDALTLFAEYQYVNLGPEAETPTGAVLDIGFKNTIAELGVGYWVFGTPKTNWEIIGGARYTKQDLNVAVQDGPDLMMSNNNWWVGFFGGRVSVQMSDKWSFIGRADYGLGGGATNRVWNLNAMFDYRLRDWGSVFVGYKWMDYDYESNDYGLDHYAYDASQQGPLLGLNFHW